MSDIRQDDAIPSHQPSSPLGNLPLCLTRMGCYGMRKGILPPLWSLRPRGPSRVHRSWDSPGPQRSLCFLSPQGSSANPSRGYSSSLLEFSKTPGGHHRVPLPWEGATGSQSSQSVIPIWGTTGATANHSHGAIQSATRARPRTSSSSSSSGVFHLGVSMLPPTRSMGTTTT